jgi:hypothetical protein
MRKMVLCLAFLFAAGPCLAATLVLKSGGAVTGTIVERTVDSVKIDVSGVTVTYYADEIESVNEDGVPVRSAAPASAEPSPAVIGPPVREAEPQAVKVPEAPGYSEELMRMSKQELILRFVDVFGTKETMQANFDQMSQSMTAEQARDFKQAFKVDDIVRELLPIYEKHFSESDLRAFIAFYDSGAGRKLVTTIPLIMKESIDVSMKYFEAHLPESMKEPPPENK